jgi:hypothetical protein
MMTTKMPNRAWIPDQSMHLKFRKCDRPVDCEPSCAVLDESSSITLTNHPSPEHYSEMETPR